jgi:penicillin-binding protein 2
MNIVSALKNSCDVFFYDISLRVGIDNIAKTCHKFGLGEISGIHLPYERNGLIPTTEWKKQTRDPIWYKGDTLNSSIGQGNVLTTPMQLAIMTARIAANAKKVKPHLVEKIAGTQQEKNTIFEKINVDPHNLQLIQRGMFEVVNGIGGTAGRSKLANPLYQMAGKTGTSQVRRISAEERRRGVTRNEQLAWNRRDHALFVGYAPYNDPVFAVAVVVEHGSSGSGTAAPIAKSVMDKALKLYPPTVITNNQEE